MPARKTVARKTARNRVQTVDPKSVKVRLLASLGETTLEANCTLDLAADLGLLLHDALEQMVQRRPSLGHTVTELHGSALDVPDDAEWEGRRVGF